MPGCYSNLAVLLGYPVMEWSTCEPRSCAHCHLWTSWQISVKECLPQARPLLSFLFYSLPCTWTEPNACQHTDYQKLSYGYYLFPPYSLDVLYVSQWEFRGSMNKSPRASIWLTDHRLAILDLVEHTGLITIKSRNFAPQALTCACVWLRMTVVPFTSFTILSNIGWWPDLYHNCSHWRL